MDELMRRMGRKIDEGSRYDLFRKNLAEGGSRYVSLSARDLLHPEKVQKLVQQGLETVFICWHGRGRSTDAASESNRDFDTPATHLSGGLQGLGLRVLTEQQAVAAADALSVVPYIVVLSTENEMGGSVAGRNSAYFLKKLEEKCAEKGTKLCRRFSSTGEDPNHTSFLKLQASTMRISALPQLKTMLRTSGSE